jgi:hypothetical protein
MLTVRCERVLAVVGVRCTPTLLGVPDALRHPGVGLLVGVAGPGGAAACRNDHVDRRSPHEHRADDSQHRAAPIAGTRFELGEQLLDHGPAEQVGAVSLTVATAMARQLGQRVGDGRDLEVVEAVSLDPAIGLAELVHRRREHDVSVGRPGIQAGRELDPVADLVVIAPEQQVHAAAGPLCRSVRQIDPERQECPGCVLVNRHQAVAHGAADVGDRSAVVGEP